MSQYRKQQIIEAASQLIAQKGFEGLRTREIAEIVGVSHATIHYHFKDKETLIEAVVQSMTEKIYQSDTKLLVSQTATVREKLETYFRNNLLQRQRHPERFVVMGELTMRANRDPVIARILAKIHIDWYARMRAVIEDGVQSGDFRPDLDTQNLAVMLITLLRGMEMQPSQEDIDKYMQLYRQIERDMLLGQ